MSEEAVLRFGMSIRETFSNSIYLAVANEFESGEVMENGTVLVKGFSEM